MSEDDESLFAAMRAGARGYIPKDADRGAAPGDPGGRGRRGDLRGIDRPQDDRLLHPAPGRGRGAVPELTEREREVLELLADGRSNADIAQRLTISQKTVRNHVANIFAKFQVDDRCQAIVRPGSWPRRGPDPTRR